jgi:4-amino-4-deoxy-L-arabinose transferase-like glycosyltransferase
MAQRILSFIKKNWIIILILLLGAFLRLYRIDDYMTFLGDEGRDALVVRNLLVKSDLILIGPGTSVGGMYLGPLYYYFMAPFLLLSNFSPVGPAIAIAVLGVATIYLVFHIGKEWFGSVTGYIASLFYAVSPVVVVYSHSSWNPNIMPFFALLSVYSIWKVLKEKRFNFLIITAISFAFVLNSHYLGVLLLPVLFLYWFRSQVSIRYTLIFVLLFSFLMSPLVIFDFRHEFMNYNALVRFLNSGGNNIGFSLHEFVLKFFDTLNIIITNLLVFKNIEIGKYVSVLLLAFSIFVLTRKDKERMDQFKLLVVWFVFGLLGFSIYRHPVYDHYFGFLFPIPFLILGYFVQDRLEKNKKILNIFLILFLIWLFVMNILKNPIMKEPNKLMERAENVSEKIIIESKNERFNIAVLSEMNYEDGYQYFLEKNNSKLVEIDPQVQSSVTNQLFVICELPKEKCDPTHSAKAEVANFGWSKIDSEFIVDGVTIYRLTHTK